jgi:plastocyanin
VTLGGRAGRLSWLVVAIAIGCRDVEPETPPPESTPAEGVFGRAPAAGGGVPSVVTVRPLAPHGPFSADRVEPGAAPADPPTMDQLGLMFSPRRLFAEVGEPVFFTNSESLAHNVNIRSIDGDSTVFNTDTPPNGRARTAFDTEGGYDVLCDVHPGMSAFIFATSAPHAAFADVDGSFHVTGLPPGEYTLAVWSVDVSARSERTVQVEDGRATEVTFAPFG